MLAIRKTFEKWVIKVDNMGKVSKIVILSVLAGACANPKRSDLAHKKDSTRQTVTQVVDVNSTRVDVKHQDSTPDFITLSKKAEESFSGNLPGVKSTDSSGPYIFTDAYINDSLTFRLLLAPKNKGNQTEDFPNLDSLVANHFRDYVAFVFVYAAKDPKKIDYHDDNTIYPTKVNAFVREDNTWKFFSTGTAKNLTEFSQFQIKCIYTRN